MTPILGQIPPLEEFLYEATAQFSDEKREDK